MSDAKVVYVLGSGSVGMALAACLVSDGKEAIAVRTRNMQAPRETVDVRLHYGADSMRVSVETVGLSKLSNLDGIVAVTAKSYANASIAAALKNIARMGPLVVMQNGVGVEKSFLDARLGEVYRCVLYLTSQGTSDNEFGFHSIKSSPIGIINGDPMGLDSIVMALTTSRFPFHQEGNIQREIWKKAIINAVFNSICPLLNVDNGVFVREQAVAELAMDLVTECIALTDRLGLGLTRDELMEQILQISKSSDGQLISTLQDIRNGRQTEIEFLNLAMARTAAAQQPRIDLSRTELLGRMTLAKSKQHAAEQTRGT
jgi:2-dehydropantoate 2-reductase